MNEKSYSGIPLAVYILPIILLVFWNLGLFTEEYNNIVGFTIFVLLIALGIDRIIDLGFRIFRG